MSQLALSNDLLEISAEINVYKQQAGQAVFEIGKRLKHVKENDLAHGQWTSWLESIDTTPRTAQRMMQAYEQFGNTTHASLLSSSKIFELLSLPESIDREQFVTHPQTVPSTGEQKMVSDMAREELREVKKELQQVQASATHYQKLWNQEKNKPTPSRVETKTIEVEPKDYGELKAKANRLELMEQELRVFKTKAQLNEKEAKEFEELKKQIGFLQREKGDLHRQIESATALSGMAVKIDHFLKTELAPIRYSRALERLDSEVAVRNLTEIIESVEHWCEDLRGYLPKNNRIEVEVIS